MDKVEAIRADLAAKAPLGIHFNSSKVINRIEGGTCSAMSLEFIDFYMKTKSLNEEQFATSSKKRRDLQAAFNTIEVIPLESSIDYSKNKIQSLANFYSLEIDHSSPEIDIAAMSHAKEIAKEVEALPDGVFLIRIIKPEDNDKLECNGHSLAIIKEEGLCLFYDPNFGVQNLSQVDPSTALFNNFKTCLKMFGISKARFYQLQPQDMQGNMDS